MYLSTAEGKLNTIYFPLTANPVGYNHLSLAECVLWQFPKTQLIIFILSNGRHPDPFKSGQIPPASLRNEILRSALREWSDPEKSLPAQFAEESGVLLKLMNDNCAVSSWELSYRKSMRLADHVNNFSAGQKVSMIVGADLIERMIDPIIFTDGDLTQIEKGSRLLAAPRNEIDINHTLKLIKQERGVKLDVSLISPVVLPENLHKFFLISSTHIRKASQAGHSLESFLPENAARHVSQNCLYNNHKPSHVVQPKYLNEHQLSCFELKEQLDEAATRLKKTLDQQAISKQPHRFAVVETTTGGQLAQAFTGLSGASEHFLDGRIIYNQEAQKQFLGITEFDDSSVSQTRAENLAEAMRKNSGADWALAETGMAGPPSLSRKSRKNGQCYLGLALSSEVRYKCLEFNPFLTRKEHQLLFVIEALTWAEKELNKQH